MKPLQTTLLLLVVALGGGLYLWLNERGPSVEEGNVVLLRAPEAQIQTVELPNARLQRSGANWTVAPPNSKQKAVPADLDAVESLLNQLQLVQSEQAVENATDLQEYGLQKPQQTVKVNGETLAFGTSPKFAPDRVYARGDGQIALVPASLAQTVSQPFDVWRDARVLRFDAEKAASLTVDLPNVTAKFRKDGDDWKFVAPLQARADANAVQSALAALSAARWDKALEAQIEKPTATIAVGDAKLEIGAKRDGGYVAQRSDSPQTFLLPTNTFEALNKPLIEWRERDLARVPFDSATKLSINWKGKTRSFTKSDAGWREGNETLGANDRADKNTRVLDVLFWLNALRATEIVDAPQAASNYGLEKPTLRVALEGDDNLTLEVGEKGAQSFARRGDQKTVYELEKGVLKGVQQPLEALFQK